MKFEYEGLSYVLEFERNVRHVEHVVDGATKKTARTSTTVRLINLPKDAVKGSKVVYRTATVGHNPHDKFTLEMGRINALRALGTTLTKPFRKALWTAYTSRKRG